ARLRAVAGEALVLAVARCAARDAAARLAGVQVRSRPCARPARWMERARRIAGAELGVAARAQALALVAGDAERPRAVTRRAVRLAAARLDGVSHDVVAGMERHRFDRALVARDALAVVVARAAARADLARLLRMMGPEVGAVRVAQAIVRRH